jgi:hypothetical protein
MADLDKRIPELPYNPSLLTGSKFPFYDPTSDTTYHINVEDFIVSGTNPDTIWSSIMNYAEGDIVVYSQGPGQPYEAWISESADNLGNVPGPASTFWTIAVMGKSGLVPWASGIYADTNVTVLYQISGHWGLYLLANPTRPYNSTDFITELGIGDWVIVGATIALPFDVIDYDASITNAYPTGTIPRNSIYRITTPGNIGANLNGNFWPDGTWLVVRVDLDGSNNQTEANWDRRA